MIGGQSIQSTNDVTHLQLCLMVASHIQVAALNETVANVARYNGFAGLKMLCDLCIEQHFPAKVRPLFAANKPHEPFQLDLAIINRQAHQQRLTHPEQQC